MSFFQKVIVAGILTSGLKKVPQRLYGVSNIFAQRCLLNYTNEGRLPKIDFFNLVDICSRENPVQEVKLSNLPLDHYKIESEKLNQLLSPYVQKIEYNICKTLDIDLKTLEKISKYFRNSTGRNFYAKTMLLVSRALGATIKEQEMFAEVIEMTHFGSVLHINLKENTEEVKGSEGFGEKGKILGGDYMISNASIKCCRIESLPLIQLLCVIVQNFARGNFDGNEGVRMEQKVRYLANSYLADTSILAYGCLGMGLLRDSNLDACFDYGAHLATANKIISDIQKVKSGLFILNSFPAVLTNCNSQDKVQEYIENFEGIKRSEWLAKLHIQSALESAKRFANSQELEIWANSLMIN